MKCHACRQENAESALFCSACRRPLVAPTKLPSRIEPLAASAGTYATATAAAGPSSGYAAAPSASARARSSTFNDRADRESAVLTDEEAWGAIVGNSNAHYYLEKFEGLRHGAGGGWNWPGFLFTWYWMLYRKMWVPALIYFFAWPYVFAVAW